MSDDMSDDTTLGDTLRQARHATGLSLDRAARATGLARSTIHRAETGTVPSKVTLKLLCRAYGIDAATLEPQVRRATFARFLSGLQTRQ